MTFTFAGLLAATWRLLRRSLDPVIAITALFVFLPAFAALLLSDPVPPIPPAPRDELAMQAWVTAMAQWGQANGLWFVVADVAGIFGAAAVAVLLLDADRPTVGQALRIASRTFWPFLIASVAMAVPVGIGLWLFVLPGLYVQARLVASIPAIARRPGLGVGRAIRVSLAMTRGHGWAITGALVTLFLAQYLVAVPLMQADEWLRMPGNANPLLLSLVDAGIAAVGAIYATGTLLVGIIIYRVRASSGT